ncbi:MAG TPA: DUF488 domain-containing protein [Devosiaceae bacterium]|nr:DUF488 domain-containing protein [Devosiaceae bacterium]
MGASPHRSGDGCWISPRIGHRRRPPPPPRSTASSRRRWTAISGPGGRRGKAQQPDASPNAFWENRSFRNYADYALSNTFRAGMLRLRQLGEIQNVAIMCSEAVWWRCHRRIIADYLLAGGDTVFHILGPNSVTQATLTPGARPTPDGAVIYPPGTPHRTT